MVKKPWNKEIVTLGVGAGGTRVAHEFWMQAAAEHGVDIGTGTLGGVPSEGIYAYFMETKDGKLKPRNVFADLEPGTIDLALTRAAYDPDYAVKGNSGAGNNYAKGHYTEGAELIDAAMNATRKLAEKCDELEGFQMCHSLGGGTGSGFGTSLLSKINQEYPKQLQYTWSVVPSPKVSKSPHG